MRGGLETLMRQAQVPQETMRKAQEELVHLTVTGRAAGSKVAVEMSGKHEVRRAHIDPAMLDGEPEMLGDLVAVALNDASAQVEAGMRERYEGLAGGLGLLAGLKLPF